MFNRKKETDPDSFWREYEEKHQEKVLAKSLGRYLGGWAGQEEPLWGLIIATSGGFRFHHFPHESWLIAITRVTTGGEAPREKTIFIPKERILSAELREEKRWWKKLFSPSLPLFVLRYRTGVDDLGEAELFVETDKTARELTSIISDTAKSGTTE